MPHANSSHCPSGYRATNRSASSGEFDDNVAEFMAAAFAAECPKMRTSISASCAGAFAGLALRKGPRLLGQTASKIKGNKSKYNTLLGLQGL